jgi:hypothetical protein
MNDQLKSKIKTLPPQIYAYFDSFKADDLNVLISEKYKLDLPQLRAYYDLVAQLFLREIPVASLPEEIKHIFSFSELVAHQMACDIAGVRLLPVVEWLGADVSGLINSWGGDASKYQVYTELQRQAIPKEAKWVAEQLAEPPEPIDEIIEEGETSWEEREKKIKEYFSSNLVEILSSDDDDFLAEFNDFIFNLILNFRESIKDELVNLMLNNQERLTSQRIVLDGRQVDPTVANWLTYFISQKGGNIFDAVALSDFMTNSPNSKFLDFDEKKMLSNLLRAYRNLKFFPDSLQSSNPKYWMIFPVTIPEEPLVKEETVDLTSPMSTTKPKVFVQPVSLTPEEEAKLALKNQQIKEAEALLARYPIGSLERLALEEELTKLRK